MRGGCLNYKRKKTEVNGSMMFPQMKVKVGEENPLCPFPTLVTST